MEDYTAAACVQFQCVCACVRACTYVFVFVCVCGVLVCVVVCVFVCWLCVYNIHVCMCVCMFNKPISANASRGGGVINFPRLLQIEIHFTKQKPVCVVSNSSVVPTCLSTSFVS